MKKNKIVFWKKRLASFLSHCQYNVKNINGNNHLRSNVTDFILLFVYLLITIIIIIKNQFNSLSYGIILVSTLRMMIKHSKRINPSKCDTDNETKETSISVAELALTSIFGTGSFIYSLLYLCIDDYSKPWVIVLFILYYIINFLAELFDILISLFNAEPRMFS